MKLGKKNEDHKITNEKDKPWHNTNDNYVLAITGEAFAYLVNLEDSNHSLVFKTLLERTQVYARMSPDHKGTLIR